MRSLLFASIVLLFSTCATPAAEVKPEPLPPPPEQPVIPKANLPMPPGLDEVAMDPAADPCGDFYQFACGNWMKTVEIPADRAITSRGFVAIAERNEQILKAILE